MYAVNTFRQLEEAVGIFIEFIDVIVVTGQAGQDKKHLENEDSED